MSRNLLTLIGYSLVIFVATFLAGKASALGKMSHTRTQLVLSLVAGFIIGIAFYHLLPHAAENLTGEEGLHQAVFFAVLGIVAMVVLLRVFHFHHHELSSAQRISGSERGQAGLKRQSFFSIAAGLSLHTVTEGIALGAAVLASMSHGQPTLLPGLGVFLVILAHKPLDAYALLSMMQAAGFNKAQRALANVCFALLCGVVALGCYLLAGQLSDAPGGGSVTASAMAFGAGAFLCVALSDLLPEIHFHTHDRFKLLAAFLVGLGLSYAIYFVEEATLH